MKMGTCEGFTCIRTFQRDTSEFDSASKFNLMDVSPKMWALKKAMNVAILSENL